MKKMRKAYKTFKKELKRAIKRVAKKGTEVVVKFPADTRYEYIVSLKEWKKGDFFVNGLVNITVQLRKDCASVTKNGDYHLLFADDFSVERNTGKDKDLLEHLVTKMVMTALTHKCKCKKDQEKRAKAMICTAKRVNGRWVY